MKILDRNQDGLINFDEFLYMLRGKPNSVRQAVIDQAYNTLDVNRDGKITAADLKDRYNSRMNPKVANG